MRNARKTALQNPLSLAHLLLFLTKIFLRAPVPPTTAPEPPFPARPPRCVTYARGRNTLSGGEPGGLHHWRLRSDWGLFSLGRLPSKNILSSNPPGLRQVPARQRLFSSTGRAVRFQLDRFGRVYFTFWGYANISLRAIWLEHRTTQPTCMHASRRGTANPQGFILTTLHWCSTQVRTCVWFVGITKCQETGFKKTNQLLLRFSVRKHFDWAASLQHTVSDKSMWKMNYDWSFKNWSHFMTSQRKEAKKRNWFILRHRKYLVKEILHYVKFYLFAIVNNKFTQMLSTQSFQSVT